MKILEKDNIVGVAALLVHAAKIDEQYSDNEKHLIKEFIISYQKDIDSEKIHKNAEQIESNSNQLLNFTSLIKKESNEIKSEIIKHLWKIMISDNIMLVSGM